MDGSRLVLQGMACVKAWLAIRPLLPFHIRIKRQVIPPPYIPLWIYNLIHINANIYPFKRHYMYTLSLIPL